MRNYEILDRIINTIKERIIENAPDSYSRKLIESGENKIIKKIGEETAELIRATVLKQDIASESADLIFHLLILLEYSKVDLEEVFKILEQREKK